jgi:hypothetical protein
MRDRSSGLSENQIRYFVEVECLSIPEISHITGVSRAKVAEACKRYKVKPTKEGMKYARYS